MPSEVIEFGFRKVKKEKMGAGDKIILIGDYCAIQSQDYALVIANYNGERCEKSQLITSATQTFSGRTIPPQISSAAVILKTSENPCQDSIQKLCEVSGSKMVLSYNQQVETLERSS